jgi:tetratricopeptide (TPR) repeat protein
MSAMAAKPEEMAPSAIQPEPEVSPMSQVHTPEQSLSQARAYIAAGAFEAAANGYERLAAIPHLREEVIQDLERAVTDHPDHHALLSALGDAYKHAGELQKALNTYKKALAKL